LPEKYFDSARKTAALGEKFSFLSEKLWLCRTQGGLCATTRTPMYSWMLLSSIGSARWVQLSAV